MCLFEEKYYVSPRIYHPTISCLAIEFRRKSVLKLCRGAAGPGKQR